MFSPFACRHSTEHYSAPPPPVAVISIRTTVVTVVGKMKRTRDQSDRDDEVDAAHPDHPALGLADLPAELVAVVLGFTTNGEALALGCTCRALAQSVRATVSAWFAAALRDVRARVAAWGGVTHGDARDLAAPLLRLVRLQARDKRDRDASEESRLPLRWLLDQARDLSVVREIAPRVTVLFAKDTPLSAIATHMNAWARDSPVDAVSWGMFAVATLYCGWRHPECTDALTLQWEAETIIAVGRLYAKVPPSIEYLTPWSRKALRRFTNFWLYGGFNESIGLFPDAVYDPCLPIGVTAATYGTTANLVAVLATSNAHALPTELRSVPPPANNPPVRRWLDYLLPLSQFDDRFLRAFIRRQILPDNSTLFAEMVVYNPINFYDDAIRASFFEAMKKRSLAADAAFFDLVNEYLTERDLQWRECTDPAGLVNMLACVIDVDAGDGVWLAFMHHVGLGNPMVLVDAKDALAPFLLVAPATDRSAFVLARLVRRELDPAFAVALLAGPVAAAERAVASWRHAECATDVAAFLVRRAQRHLPALPDFVMDVLLRSGRDGALGVYLAAFSLPGNPDDWPRVCAIAAVIQACANYLAPWEAAHFYELDDTREARVDRLPLFRALGPAARGARSSGTRRHLARKLALSHTAIFDYMFRHDPKGPRARVLAVPHPDAPSGMQLRAVADLRSGEIVADADARSKYAARGPADTANATLRHADAPGQLVLTRNVGAGEALIVSVEEGL